MIKTWTVMSTFFLFKPNSMGFNKRISEIKEFFRWVFKNDLGLQIIPFFDYF